MADTVDTQVRFDGLNRYSVRIQNRSDGTGESGVVKVDKSTLTGPIVGTEPGRLALEEIRWAVQGFVSVRLDWDHTTDDELITLSGNGYESFRETGKVVDPNSTGGTGDVLLTTNGAVSGATYDITMTFKKKA